MKRSLYSPRVGIRLQRQAARVTVNDFRQHSRHAEQFDVRPDGRRPVVPGEVDVLDLPSHVPGREVEDARDAREAPRADVPGEILPVGLDDGIVDVADIPEAVGACEREDGFRHAASEEVGPQQLQQSVVNGRVQPALHFEAGDPGGELLLPDGVQELREGHGPQVQVRHPTHRHGEAVVREGEVEQRSGGQHGQTGHVLPQVAERGNGFRHGLDLVEEQQPVGADGADARQRLQDVEQPGGIVPRESPGQVGAPFEVDLGQRASRTFSEQPDKRGFAHLAGAAKDQRLPVRLRQPVVEQRELLAVHWRKRHARCVSRK